MNKTKAMISITTVVLDYVLIVAAFALSYLLRGRLDGATLVPLEQFLIFAFIAGVIYVLMFIYLGLYSTDRKHGLVDQLLGLVIGSLSATAISGSVIYFARSFDYSRLVVGMAFLLAILFVWSGRILLTLIERIMYRENIGVTNVLIIGNGDLLGTTVRGFLAGSRSGYRLVGVIPTKPGIIDERSGDFRIYDPTDVSAIEGMVKDQKIHEIILTDPEQQPDEALKIINLCERNGIRFKYVPSLFDVVTARIVPEDLAGMPIIELRTTLLEGWMVVLKRLIDVVSVSLGLIILSPLFLVTGFAIKMTSKGPILFKHKRVGQHGKEFDVVKFRSMAMLEKDGQLLHASENKEVEMLKEKNSNYKLENDPRITKVGHIIRKTSIDELPQLWNVLKGDMSLVGPRPYLDKELTHQQNTYPQTKALVQRLLAVKPGITGLWQVSGRSNIDFTERVAMDAYYATQANIWLDLKILLQTLPVVLKGSGAM